MPRLATAYGFGVARNHPFIDGNKRTTVLLVAVFSSVNGWRFDPNQVDEVRTVVALAAGDPSEETFAEWVEGTAVERSGSRRRDAGSG